MFATFTIISCAFLSLLSDHPHAQSQDEYDVIIMGAGAAGIASAKTLYEAGITNILIIEAQWFVGGRTVVHHFDEYFLNIGASWISGTCNPLNNPLLANNCSDYTEMNPMLEAANKYNYSFVISEWKNLEKIMILDFGGTEHNKTEYNNRDNEFHEALDCVYRLNRDDISMSAALHLCGWTAPFSAIDKTIQWVNYEFDYGRSTKWGTADPDPDGAPGTYSRYGPTDVFITDERGYQGIIKNLANEFLDIDNIENEEKIILNSPITTIQYGENNISVKLENSTEYHAKYGIVTFSLGVLQSDIVEFIPKLPSWKIDNFLAFDFIDYVPILVQWPYNFWNDTIMNGTEFILLNDDRFGFFPWIYNLDHPNLYNGSLIWRFDITLDLAQNVAMQNINDTIKQIVDLKLSHYFDNVPDPENIFVASWYSNKFIQGAYSNWPVGFTHESKKAMGWPLVPSLFFAGEAVHDWGGGFVHTAWLNGNATANKILSCMGYQNGFECPSKYIPPSHDQDCQSMNDDVFKNLAWLWIILGLIVGIIFGCLFKTYFNKIAKNKGDNNYGSVDNMSVPMVIKTDKS